MHKKIYNSKKVSYLKVFCAITVSVLLISCGGASESSSANDSGQLNGKSPNSGINYSKLTSMCGYQHTEVSVASVNYQTEVLRAKCVENKITSCREDAPRNKTIAQYDNLELCEGDLQYVKDHYVITKKVILGPNAINKHLPCDINENYNGSSRTVASYCNSACDVENNNNPYYTLEKSCNELGRIGGSHAKQCKADCSALNSAGSCNVNNVWTGASDDHARFYCLDACNWLNVGGDNAQQAVDTNCKSLASFGAQGSCNISCN